ncbi:hypothetical protein BAY59_31095 [Prauserella coralliicola]|nr:hypothetical protein BAY59_31095 [Prauserella coralliicola]
MNVFRQAGHDGRLEWADGATLSAEAAATGAHVLTACLRNAHAVAVGAGAVVAALLDLGARRPSPEASLAALAWRAAGPEAGALVAGSASGRELRENGHGRLVGHATAAGCSRVVPRLTSGVYERG